MANLHILIYQYISICKLAIVILHNFTFNEKTDFYYNIMCPTYCIFRTDTT